MPSKPKTGRRSLVGTQHSIIVRYDFDACRWVHSAGIVITPREATLLEALAKGITTADMQEAAGMGQATYYAAQARLKHYFGIPLKTHDGQHRLMKIAMDLYGNFPSKFEGRGRSSNRGSLSSGAREIEASAATSVDALTGNSIGPGSAPSHAL